jgi:phage major head subunit gpT-like protein
MQINQTTLAALFRGYKTLFLEAFHGAAPEWSKFAMRAPSSAAAEIYHWLGAVPGMRELLGEIVIQNLKASNYTITNREFESTVGVKQADIERDTYGIYNPLMQAMGQAGAEHPDELVAYLLINGFTLTDYTGQTFFHDAHLHSVGGPATYAFDNKMTEKFSAAGYELARKRIRSVLNEKGRPMNLGKKLLLIVSPSYEATAKTVLQSSTVPNAAGTASQDNVNKGTADLLVWGRLAADEHKWFLMDVGHPVKPVILQEEKPVSLASLTNPDSDHVFKKHEFLYQAYGRYAAGYGLPQLVVGSTGAAAAL